MMRVLLINLRGVYPPIGLGYLASSLEASDVDVSILDCGGYGYTEPELLERVRDEVERMRPDVAGITCFTPQARLALDASGAVKDGCGECLVVLGGPHPTMAPFDVIRDPNVDFVVVGEGERTLVELADAVEGGRRFGDVDGILWRANDKVVVNRPREPLEDLDELPFPAYHLFPDYKLRLEIDGHGLLTLRRPHMPIFTSRGCPFQCIYCHRVFGKGWRARSPENVVEEIEFLNRKYGVKEVHIEDDNFNLDVERAKRIFDLMVERGLDVAVKFPNGMRADFMDEELVVKMRRAGVYSVAFGVETASPRIMERINKGLDLRSVERAVRLCVGHGLHVRGFFMIGFPWETKEDIWRTIEYAKNLDIHFASFSIATPYPGTELYDIAVRGGYLREDDYGKYAFAKPVIETPEFTREDLVKMKEMAESEFYSHPKRELKLLPSIDYFIGELFDYYSSPMTDYYCLLLIQHFGTYGTAQSIV